MKVTNKNTESKEKSNSKLQIGQGPIQHESQSLENPSRDQSMTLSSFDDDYKDLNEEYKKSSALYK